MAYRIPSFEGANDVELFTDDNEFEDEELVSEVGEEEMHRVAILFFALEKVNIRSPAW